MNPIAYTSRTYNTIINDINSDTNLKDRPEWFKRLIAGLGDVLSMWNNVSANQSFLRTCFTRQAAKDLLQLIDYILTPQTTSDGTCIFFLEGGFGGFPVTFTKEELTSISEGSIVISSQKFSPRSGITINASSGTFTWSGANNILTVANDFELTGHKLRFTTTNTLPTGLAVDTDYYIVYISTTEIKVATSLANALAGIVVTISGAGVGTHTWHLYSFSKVMYQEELIASQIIGASDGVTSFQIIDLPDKLVLKNTLSITIGGNPYTLVDTLVDSTSIDKHFKFLVKSDGYSSIMFGDNTYGIIPPANDIYAEYSIGGGSNSNVTILNKINNYTGGNSNIKGVFNTTTFIGGANEESVELAKILAPLLLKARNRFVTVEDGEALALNYGGLSYVKILKNFYGVLSCKFIAIANGGGNPSGTLRGIIQDYLIARTSLAEMDVRFEVYSPTTLTVTSGTKVKSGYNWSGIQDYVTIAWKLFFSETGKEIIDKYNYEGIDEVISLINIIFSTSFTSIDNEQIKKIILGLENIGFRQFGDTIQESDAISFIQSSINGIDYITITLPAFPMNLAVDTITTHTGSTFNLTEIV